MEQLLTIKTTPISLKYDITPASIELSQPKAQAHPTREQGGLEMRSEQIKVQINSYNCRKYYGFKNTRDLTNDYAEKGKIKQQEGVSKIVSEGNQMADALAVENDKIISQLAYQNFSGKTVETVMTFIPGEKPDISWKGGTLDISYKPEKIRANWEIQKNKYKYIPGSFKVTVEQYPSIEITYTGSPIYVPPSADPNYKPIDEKA